MCPGMGAGLPTASLSLLRCTQYCPILQQCPKSKFLCESRFLRNQVTMKNPHKIVSRYCRLPCNSIKIQGHQEIATTTLFSVQAGPVSRKSVSVPNSSCQEFCIDSDIQAGRRVDGRPWCTCLKSTLLHPRSTDALLKLFVCLHVLFSLSRSLLLLSLFLSLFSQGFLVSSQ